MGRLSRFMVFYVEHVESIFKVWQRFASFFNLWDFSTHVGLRECHLFDIRGKHFGRPAISCSKFGASPPRTEMFVDLGENIQRKFTLWKGTPSQMPTLTTTLSIIYDLQHICSFLSERVKERREGDSTSTMVVISDREVLPLIDQCWLTLSDHLSIVSSMHCHAIFVFNQKRK